MRGPRERSLFPSSVPSRSHFSHPSPNRREADRLSLMLCNASISNQAAFYFSLPQLLSSFSLHLIQRRMLSKLSGVVWMEEGADEEQDAVSWARPTTPLADAIGAAMGDGKQEMALPCFKSILDDGWYVAASSACGSSGNQVFAGIDAADLSENASLVFPPPVDSSSSCSPSSVFVLDPSAHQAFLPPKPEFSSLLSAVCSNPFDTGFGFPYDTPSFLPRVNSSVFLSRGGAASNVGGGVLGFPGVQISGQDLLHVADSSPAFNPMVFDSFDNSPLLNRAKVLGPLEIFPHVGAQPTLFQKRAAAALRQNSRAKGGERAVVLGILGSETFEQGRSAWEGSEHEKNSRNDEEDLVEASFDGSGLNYDSEDFGINQNVKVEEEKNGGTSAAAGCNGSNTNSALSGAEDPKVRKKGLPAKNLMAERRRRKKLNDRLYMLRSIVPKISKMDRASILGDAIEYLKELLQRINDLHDELESTNSSLETPSATSCHPLTPTPTLPCRFKEELCPSSLLNLNGQPARVEVRMREGGAVNIHMFCARRAGLLLSTMRALDGLGLDIQQAVISCFNGFALDVFRAEQSNDEPGILPEEIKEVLLHSAGFQNTL